MKYRMGIVAICIMGVSVSSIYGEPTHNEAEQRSPSSKIIKILLGSTRQGRRSEKIGKAVYEIVKKNQKAHVEILDLREWALPWFDDANPPFQREGPSADPVVRKWSEMIEKTDALIILVPDYNQGYSAVLKNAIDLLFREWSGKRIALVGYGDAGNGGEHAAAQLREVLRALSASLVADQLLIPIVYQALDQEGKFINKEYEPILEKMMEQLIV